MGVDKKEEDFLITAQISLPSKEEQGGTQTSQIAGQGKTVSQAFRMINVKTGWYPKLVFCKLIVLGETLCQNNVFQALDFFLRDEYFPDSCLLAACKGEAAEIINAKTPVDKISGIAAQKVLSPYLERAGTVAPTTLREFAQEYYASGKSGVLPVLSTAPPNEEKSGGKSGGGSENSGSGSGSGKGAKQSGQSTSGEQSSNADEKIYQAKTSALFFEGKKVGELTERETFAFCLSKNKLRLADYGVSMPDGDYTLNFRYTRPSVKLSIDENGVPRLDILVKITAGINDSNTAPPVEETENPGNIPQGLFEKAEKTLTEEITQAFETCRAANCDALELFSELERKEKDYAPVFQKDLLERLILSVEVKMDSVR